MKTISVQRSRPGGGDISPLGATRDWMDETFDKHAYMCFPITVTNRLGWGIHFPEDIVFVWDGIDDTSSDHVKVLKGEQYASPKRGNATISFETGLLFRTDESTTMLTMPVPNQFIRGTQCFTTLISTSFYRPELPVAWKLTEPNVEVTIPAGTPVAAVLPISLTSLQEDYKLELNESYPGPEFWDELRQYGEAAQEKNATSQWSKMYRDAVDHKGNIVGAHETKSIRLQTATVCPITGRSAER
jgi:hypothetical protein